MVTSACLGRQWTDVSGNHRIEAELVFVRHGKAYLEKPEGEVVVVPVNRLSKEDRAIIEAFRPQHTLYPTSELPTESSLERKTVAILRAKCYRCHGKDGTAEGGLNFVLDLEKLAKSYVNRDNVAESQLLERLTDPNEDNRMPPPGEQPGITEEEIAVVRRWMETGAKPVQRGSDRRYLSQQAMLQEVLNDLKAASPADRKFFRYLTLTHLYNAGATAEELQTYRLAAAKLLNSLSWHAELMQPYRIDAAGTVLRIDLRKLDWDSVTWDHLVGANPYALLRGYSEEESCRELTGCELPAVRGDWFVHAASRPPLYHTILGIPHTDRELETRLGVPVADNIASRKVVRAAFNRSGVSQHNRMIERHATQYGSYWKSYDFAGSAGRQNLFRFPLGPGSEDNDFVHDGGEIIFTLPNGLHGYMLTNGRGERIDQGPTSIVSDPNRPDRAVTNGVSCMSCHYAGMIAKSDEIRRSVQSNPLVYKDVPTILALYPLQLRIDSHFETEGANYVKALRQIGMTRISKTEEPVSSMALHFESELDLAQVAAELGLSAEQLDKKLTAAPDVARLLGSLRVGGGTIKREQFVKVFTRAAFDLDIAMGAVVGGQRSVRIDRKPDADGYLHKVPMPSSDSIQFFPDGSSVLLGFETRLDMNSGETTRIDVPHDLFSITDSEGVVHQHEVRPPIVISGDGKRIMGTEVRLSDLARDKSVVVIDISEPGRPKLLQRLDTGFGMLSVIAPTHDGRYVAIGCKGMGLTQFWDVDRGRLINQARFSYSAGKISRDANLLYNFSPYQFQIIDFRKALARPSKDLQPFVKQQYLTADPLASSHRVQKSAGISPDGTRLVVALPYNKHENRVKFIVRDSHTRDFIAEFELDDVEKDTLQLAMTPDARHVIIGENDRVRIYNIESGRSQSFDGYFGYDGVIAVSPDNRHFAIRHLVVGKNRSMQAHVVRIPDLD